MLYALDDPVWEEAMPPLCPDRPAAAPLLAGMGWQRLERGMRFEVALAGCTGIDLACSTVRLRQQHAQALMVHFVTIRTA